MRQWGCRVIVKEARMDRKTDGTHKEENELILAPSDQLDTFATEELTGKEQKPTLKYK